MKNKIATSRGAGDFPETVTQPGPVRLPRYWPFLRFMFSLRGVASQQNSRLDSSPPVPLSSLALKTETGWLGSAPVFSSRVISSQSQQAYKSSDASATCQRVKPPRLIRETESVGRKKGKKSNVICRGVLRYIFLRNIRKLLDLLSIPQSGGKNVKTFRWNHIIVLV